MNWNLLEIANGLKPGDFWKHLCREGACVNGPFIGPLLWLCKYISINVASCKDWQGWQDGTHLSPQPPPSAHSHCHLPARQMSHVQGWPGQAQVRAQDIWAAKMFQQKWSVGQSGIRGYRNAER